MLKNIVIAVLASLSFFACVGVADDAPQTSTDQEELRYSCGIEGGGCYCCYDMDAYTGCCMCPQGGARCR